MDTHLRAERFPLLEGLLWLLVVVPALAVSWGFESGRVVFVLYREPKGVAAAVLGWLFLALFCWRRPLGRASLATLSGRPGSAALAVLAAFVSYLAITGLWVRVPQNFFYELQQYVLLLLLLVALWICSKGEAKWAKWVRAGLLGSQGAVTLVGLTQIFWPMSFLTPIEPAIGVAHPSLMGYKNPAALAILGQIFLLAQAVLERSKKDRRRAAVLALLLMAELFYLASLESRTAYAAFVVAIFFLIGMASLRLSFEKRPRRWLRTLGAAAFILLFFGAGIAAHAPARERALTLLSYLESPRTFLESDRGTYLRNTLNMVRHHPFGVGLGDWQTQYAVYRLHNRDLAFNAEYQVRRAHSDHVQFLGEAGWPGLFLWLFFLGLSIGGLGRDYLRHGKAASLLTATQLVALAAAMATDYVVESPYHKLQFFLVVFLALASRDREEGQTAGSRTVDRAKTSLLVAILVSAIAAVEISYYLSLARKIHVAAELERTYRRAIESSASQATRPYHARSEFEKVFREGRPFVALPGHTKTFYKTYLLLGHTAQWLGERPAAIALTARSLDLHPYNPNALLLMSSLAEDPLGKRQWRRVRYHVLRQATRGFTVVYPDYPEP